jgi:hypothetical protein
LRQRAISSSFAASNALTERPLVAASLRVSHNASTFIVIFVFIIGVNSRALTILLRVPALSQARNGQRAGVKPFAACRIEPLPFSCGSRAADGRQNASPEYKLFGVTE